MKNNVPAAPLPYYPGIPLDEFDDIVLVSWGQETILDFVHDKYMVKGKRQKRAHVLHADDVALVQTPVAVPGFEKAPFEGVGLDLRGPVDAFGMPTRGVFSADRNAKLRNKVNPPTKKDPGALNEFTFLDYTIVIEFEWFDIEAAFYRREGGFDPINTGGWDNYDIPFTSRYSRTDEGSPDGWFALQQTLAKEDFKAGGTVTSDEDYDSWDINPQYGLNGLQSLPGNNFQRAQPPGSGDMTWYDRSFFYKYGAPVGCGYEFSPGFPSTTYVGLTGTQPLIFQAGPSSYTIPNTDFSEFFTRPSLQTLDQKLSVGAPAPRNVPGAYNVDDGYAEHPGFAVPYGKTRIAANVSKTQIAMAANGRDVQVKTQNSALQIPRLTPMVDGKRSGNFPVREFVLTPTPHQVQGAEVEFFGYVRIRYVRLYRKRKPTASLKKLSIVPARIPKWW